METSSAPDTKLIPIARRRKKCGVCNHSILKRSELHTQYEKFVDRYKRKYVAKFCCKCRNIIGKELRVAAPPLPPCKLPKYILRHWKYICTGSKEPIKPFGVPILYCNKEWYSPWLYTMIKGIYKTRADWYDLFDTLLNSPDVPAPCTSDIVSLKSPNPFLYRKHIANHLYNLFLLNLRVRMTILKMVQRRLLAKMDKRIVGETDLYTTVAIPKNSLVTIYDFKTKAKYVFHTTTILNTIMASLKHSAYGIPKPSEPKNPYTNLPWTVYQLTSISQQIIQNMVGINRLPPQLFINYFRLNFSLGIFVKICEIDLGINAANELFKMKDDYDTREIYGETIDDMVYELSLSLPYSLRSHIVERKLSDDLQNRWDELVPKIWIYTNIHILQSPYKTYTELTDDFDSLLKDTRKYMYENVYRQRQRTPSLRRTQEIQNLINANIYADENELVDADAPLAVIMF
jgi:hypothetical protein